MAEKKYDLEDRFVEFVSRVVEVVEALPKTRAGNYIAGQVIRCGLARHYFMEKLKVPNPAMILFIK